ncbi:MAG: alginate lyase family protein [Gammaproteobacteria bacterium]|nr:alginate lyase family protein [Gammaproteobacteria bacterium]
MFKFFVLGCSLLLFNLTAFAQEKCVPLLWPTTSLLYEDVNHAQVFSVLKKQADKAMHSPSQAIEILASAGITNITDKKLQNSRRVMREADQAAVLALTYRLSSNKAYLEKAREILLLWSAKNHPTGNPINETRLEGLIWAYDLIACQLSSAEQIQIKTWFTQLRKKKMAWHFGPATRINNHRTHQLKMVLLLDKVLGLSQDFHDDIKSSEQHAEINLDPKTGQSYDYHNRSSLYYHQYDLQPWLEIKLITQLNLPAIDKAYYFMQNKIRAHEINGEFKDSKAPIDALRAKGGFSYAVAGSQFDIKRAAPSILTFYTQHCAPIAPDMLAIVRSAKPSPWLAFLQARQMLWQACKTGSLLNLKS